MEYEMKIAFLITAYNKIDQLVYLAKCLGNKNGYENIFIHIDKKSNILPLELINKINPKINIIKKYKVYWGGFNQLLSILALAREASKKGKYDFMVLLSGQDVPIKSYNELLMFLSKNKGKSFITSTKFPKASWNYNQGYGRVQWYWFMDHMRFRGVDRFHKLSHYIYEKFKLKRRISRHIEFYGGSDWWMLPGEVVEYCSNEFKKNRKIRKIFKYSFIPTEMFFQTIIGNSIYKNTVTNNSKRFIYWQPLHSGYPEIITSSMKTELEKSDCFFARKFDMDIDENISKFYASKF